MALISGALPPNTCYGTPQQLIDLFAQYLSLPGQNLILEAKKSSPTLAGNTLTSGTMAAGTEVTFTVDVAGASLNDVVAVNPSTKIDKCVVDGYVSGANTVTVRIMSLVSRNTIIPNLDYFVKVMKFSLT